MSKRLARCAGRWPALLLLALTVGCAHSSTPAVRAPTATRVDGDAYELSAFPSQFLLAGQRVLFTAAASPAGGSRHLYRLDLASGEVDEVLRSRFYPDGVLDSYRFCLAGDWLVYLEAAAGDNGRSWTLAAQHLATGEVVILDRAAGDEVGWPGPEVAADGDRVVWVRREDTAQGLRSLIHAHNLATGEAELLGEPLDATREVWGWPDLAGGRLVVERMGVHPSLPQARVVLIDLESGQETALSGDEPASEPAFDGRYVAWKAGPRYGRGRLVVYDLERGEARTLDLEAEYPHVEAGRVVAWVEGSGWVQIEAADGARRTLAAADLQPGREVSLEGARTAWVEVSGGGQGPVRFRVSG